MAAGSVMLSLPQMVDLALCTPEKGVVNFNLLHAILHILVQQLQLGSCNVEFKGDGGQMIQNILELTKNTNTSVINLTEYVIAPAKDAGKVVKRKSVPATASPVSADAEGVVDAGEEIQMGKTEGEDMQTVVVVEQATDSPSYVPLAISKNYVQDLQNDVDSLKQSVKELTELPTNATLIEALRSNSMDKATPVLDMFQLSNLSKRVDAAEITMQKLASMMEDLARRNLPDVADFSVVAASDVSSAKAGTATTKTAKPPQDVVEAIKKMDERIAHIENSLATQGDFETITGVPPTSEPIEGKPSFTESILHETEASAPDRKSDASNGVGTGKLSLEASSKIDVDVDLTKLSPDDFRKSVEDEIRKIKQHLKLLYDKLAQQQQPQRRKPFATESSSEGELPPEERLTDLEEKFEEYTQQISGLDATFNAELTGIHDQFAHLEKEMGVVLERVNLGLPAGDSNVGVESMSELYDKIMVLQSDIDTLGDTATKLVEDMDEKQKWMDALLEQVEMLKTIKADKEDLEDALADKADACAINRKVSHDQFDTACDELSKGIEEALGKLTQQENMWQQALDEIQKEIDNKLDRLELGPLKDFVNNKLKMLQQRLKALTALKQEAEAAGTKKFLRNVNCISCDKEVVMRKEMDPSLVPPAYSLPPTKSMGPYLAYELDALRKQQKTLATSRNLHHFESAVNSKSPRGEDHVCNRYCGGSHTVTTPQQRVTRLGHFLKQWGLESTESAETERKDEVAMKGEALSNKPTKMNSFREQTTKEDIPGVRRASSAQTHPKKTTSSEKRTSKQKLSSPKGSGERLEKQPNTAGQTSPKGSKDNLEKKRGAPPAAVTQKTSPTPAKRGSQVSNKSGEAAPGPNDKVGLRLSFNIPEEAASQAAEVPPGEVSPQQPEATLEPEG